VALRALVVGGLPLVAWEAFSLVYYGILVPNTALAKLGAGVSHPILALQGLRYFVALLRWDLLGAIVLVLGLGVGLWRRRPLALGVLLYLGYIVWIGGDFMCGRFFMVPIVLAGLLAAELPWPPRAWLLVAVLPAYLVVPIFDMGPVDWLFARKLPQHYWGVIDERIFYSQFTGAFDRRRPRSISDDKFATAGIQARRLGVLVETCIGMVGYHAGRGVEIIDPMALSDPLLARLPIDDKVHFRIGHFLRGLPEGYLTSVYSGKNEIVDPDLARYWAAVERVTRGPIWAGDRWRAIWALHSGKLDPLRDAYVARREERLRAAASGSPAR
jgi:arabinofuranosyltransferase